MQATYAAYVASDLYNAGNSCDGHPFFAESFYVVIENVRGTRFRHVASFRSTQRLICEETGEAYFNNLHQEASDKAERLAARVNDAFASGKGIDWAYWVEIDPAYGSEEYQSQGIEAQRAHADCYAA